MAGLRRVPRCRPQVGPPNGHRPWAGGVLVQAAGVLTEGGEFERARAVCEEGRPSGAGVLLDPLPGAIVLGFAHLGLKRHAAAFRSFQEVTAQSRLMRSILHMPLRLGLGQYWLARAQFDHAREELQELCRLAAASGERTYLALGRQA